MRDKTSLRGHMSPGNMPLWAAAAISATLIGASTSAFGAPSFTATNLGTLGGTNAYLIGGAPSYGGDFINASGQVVGYSNTVGTGTNDGYFTGANGSGITPIGNLGTAPTSSGNATYSYGINSSGEVTGTSYISSAVTQAYLSSPNSAITSANALGSFTSGLNSYGIAVNDSGQVVGFGYNGSSSSYDAFRTGAAGNGGVSEANNLGTISLLSGANSAAYGINSLGQVVGVSSVNVGGSNASHAFRTSATGTLTAEGTADDLGVLPGGSSSYAVAINALGEVVGTSTTTDGGSGSQHAFLIPTATGTLTSGGAADDLGTLGGTISTAYDINTQGQVVGYSYTTGNAAAHAIIYNAGSMVDLNNITTGLGGFTLTRAYSINDSDQIAAIATSASGTTTNVFLLNPTAVPEPASLSLAAGVMMLLGKRRRRGM